jgi:redox-sensitive bicupin YhaK (pirin superfamily)
MTAGKGVLHSETPMQAEGLMWGFQLWVNLPAKEKMKEPRYQDIDASKIPAVELGENGTVVRLIAGKLGDVEGAVNGIPVDPILLDVMLPAGQIFDHPIPEGHTLFVYTVDGASLVGVGADALDVPASRIVLFKPNGNTLRISAPDDAPSRFLVIAGAPLNEPIARHGPFVMNTREEIIQCFRDMQSGKLA